MRKRQSKHYLLVIKHHTLMFQSTFDTRFISKEHKIFWKKRQINGNKKYLLDLKRGAAPRINLVPIEK
jgi:hypothetical protein